MCSSMIRSKSNAFSQIRPHFRTSQAIQIRVLAAVGVESCCDNPWLLRHQRLHFARRVRISWVEQTCAFDPFLLLFQAVQNKPVIIPIRFWMHQHRTINAVLIHVRQICFQRIRRLDRGIGCVGCLFMKRIPFQIWTKNVCIPFDNHRAPPIDGLCSHRAEISLHSNPSRAETVNLKTPRPFALDTS